ncbi:hypothetical protein [Streptomyces sp. NPDC058664]|uniref:DUF7455 domain-containing protein n=1 Tax=unclassified Streptomyces TaxID=2593676 RepID=UPI00365CFF7B
MTMPTIPSRPITAQDRCDRCVAQAYVRATLTHGRELLFCAHHYHFHGAALHTQATHVHDETPRLTVPAPTR